MREFAWERKRDIIVGRSWERVYGILQNLERRGVWAYANQRERNGGEERERGDGAKL